MSVSRCRRSRRPAPGAERREGARHRAEEVVADVPETAAGSVMEKLAQRKGRMDNMEHNGDRVQMRFIVPSRGLFGYRGEFLTDTRGEGILYRTVKGFEPLAGDLPGRGVGPLVCTDQGRTTPHAIFKIQERALELFHKLGMRIRYMNPEAHDRHIAYVSHLSHISSFMLGKTVIEKEQNERDIFDMAGSGFESTVRLAKSSPAPENWSALPSRDGYTPKATWTTCWRPCNSSGTGARRSPVCGLSKPRTSCATSRRISNA